MLLSPNPFLNRFFSSLRIPQTLALKSPSSASNRISNLRRLCSLNRVKMHNGAAGTNQSPRGALVVLEGLDRSGKSSQCSKLVSYLEGIGVVAELWRFPDRTTSVGKMISTYLSNEAHLDDRTVHLLFSANRWEKRSSMEDKLKAGITLVVDRYSYSGVASHLQKGFALSGVRHQREGCQLQISCYTLISHRRKLQKEEAMEVKDMSILISRRKLLRNIMSSVVTHGRLLMLAYQWKMCRSN